MTADRRRFARIVALTLGLGALYGCSGGLSCGSSSGCTNGYAYPQTTATVPNGVAFVDDGVRVRLTQQALAFLTENIRPLLATALGADPSNPDVIRLPLTDRQDLGGGFSLGVGGIEEHPTEIFIDAAALANGLTTRFVGAEAGEESGIHLHAENVPVGIDARIFFGTNVLGLSATAACDLFGTNDDLGGSPWFTTFTLDATLKPRIGSGAECDNHAPECLKLSVQVNDAAIGSFSYDSIELDLPSLTACADDGPGECSEECSDTLPFIDGDGDNECQGVCFVGDLAIDLVGALGGLLNDVISGFLPGILESALVDVLDEFDGSPLSASGRLNLAGFAAGILPESSLDLGYGLAPTAGAFDVNRASATPAGALGMDLIMKTGFEAAPSLVDDTSVPHPCVRPISGGDFSALYGAFEFQVPDAAPLTGVFNGSVYHLGASLGAAALNQALFAAYNSGALCLEVSTESIARLTAGSDAPFQLTAGAIDLLLEGKLNPLARPESPVIIALAPSQPPVLTYGAGDDTEGHLKVSLPSVEVSFYALINERFSRVFAVAADVALQLSVFEDPATSSLRISVVDGPRVDNFVEKYNELIPGVDVTGVLESLVGIAFDAALGDGLEFNFDVGPVLSDALGVPIFVDFVGLETAPASDRQFLNVYLSLDDAPPAQARTAAAPRPRLALEPGVVRAVDSARPLQVRPTGEVRIESDDMAPMGAAPVEYFVRVDFGAWRGPLLADAQGVLTVRDPKLRVVGAHTVTLRSRLVGEPASMGAASEPMEVWVDADAPRVELVQVGHTVVARGWDLGTRTEELRWQWQLDEGAWSEPGPDSVRPLEELFGRRVAVRAWDLAGNVSRGAGLDLTVARMRAAELSSTSHTSSAAGGGCAAQGLDGAWLAGLGLTLLLGRRRARRGA